jgi:transposase
VAGCAATVPVLDRSYVVRIVSRQQKSDTLGVRSKRAVREIRRRGRRRFSAEEKIRIVLEGLRGEESIAALCRRKGIASNLYYRWSKEFLEAGKKRLNGDTVLEATSNEVKVLRSENRELKEVVAEMTLKNRVLKKSLTGLGEEVAS